MRLFRKRSAARRVLGDGGKTGTLVPDRAGDYRAVRTAVAALESCRGDFTAALLPLYQAAARLAPEEEVRRWERRLDIVRAGRRVHISTAPAEVLAGRDLSDLEHARVVLDQPDAVELMRDGWNGGKSK
jgi:hypothetical protein